MSIPKVEPISSGSYLPLPEIIKKKKCLVNVRNFDNNLCFANSISAAFVSPKVASRESYYVEFRSTLKYPSLYNELVVVDPNDKTFFQEFEDLNDIKLNILTVNDHEIETKDDTCIQGVNVTAIFASKRMTGKEIDLLYYTSEDGKKGHYVFIRSLSALAYGNFLNGRPVSKGRAKKHICRRCFYSTERKDLHEKHVKSNVCNIGDSPKRTRSGKTSPVYDRISEIEKSPNFIVLFLDLETTGLKLTSDYPVQLGGCIYIYSSKNCEWEKTNAEFESTIFSSKSCSFEAESIHKISHSDIVKSPLFPQVWKKYKQWVKDFNSAGLPVVFAGHNVLKFDIPILVENLLLYSLDPQIEFKELNIVGIFDTLPWSKLALSIKKHDLSSIYAHCCENKVDRVHTALYDCKLVSQICTKMNIDVTNRCVLPFKMKTNKIPLRFSKYQETKILSNQQKLLWLDSFEVMFKGGDPKNYKLQGFYLNILLTLQQIHALGELVGFQ